MVATSQEYIKWNNHAKKRKKERNIIINSNISFDYISKLPYYINNGCHHYCDGKKGVIYYVRDKTMVTIIKANPIAILRKICMINEWEFRCICRDNLFGNCRRGSKCKYDHKEL